MAQESGIETPTTEDLVRLDRKRKGKKLSNSDWESPTDPDARIAKLKDGRTHLAYKPEHAMDLVTGAVVAAEMHLADQGDTTTMPSTLSRATEHLNAVDAAPTSEAPAELIADKGYHPRDALKALDGGPWKSRISEPHHDEFLRWHGDDAARRAVYNNRIRLRSGVARQAFKLRAELVERGFALILDRGGMRRVWLRGRRNVQKRYLMLPAPSKSQPSIPAETRVGQRAVKGELLGAALYNPDEAGGFIGIGFAISAELAKFVVDRLLDPSHPKPGWLGVTLQDLTQELSLALGVGGAKGAIIAAVNDTGPAQAAGLRPSDVLLAINGLKLNDARAYLRTIVKIPVSPSFLLWNRARP